jgi:hypothetical protein
MVTSLGSKNRRLACPAWIRNRKGFSYCPSLVLWISLSFPFSSFSSTRPCYHPCRILKGFLSPLFQVDLDFIIPSSIPHRIPAPDSANRPKDSPLNTFIARCQLSGSSVCGNARVLKAWRHHRCGCSWRRRASVCFWRHGCGLIDAGEVEHLFRQHEIAHIWCFKRTNPA